MSTNLNKNNKITLHIITQFQHKSMIIFNTSAMRKIPTDSSTWRRKQKCSMRSPTPQAGDIMQTAPDCLHGIWLQKKGVAQGTDWQCGARFVGMCLSGATSTRRQTHKSPDRKTAAVNHGIQVGLGQTSLGINWLWKIQDSAYHSPSSRKSLQKISNILMDKIEKLNEADMIHSWWT